MSCPRRANQLTISPFLSLCEGCQWRECNRYVTQLKTRDTSDPSPLILIPTLPSDTKEQAECPGWGKRKGCRRMAGALSHRISYETRDREGNSLCTSCARGLPERLMAVDVFRLPIDVQERIKVEVLKVG